MDRLRLGAVGEELEQARSLAARDPECVSDPARVEPAQPCRDRGGREGAADGGRVEAAHVELPRAREPDPRADHEAGDRRREHLLPARAERLAAGERDRGDDDRGVDERVLVGVVEVERVHHRAVRERRDGGGQPLREPERGRLRAAPELLREAARGLELAHREPGEPGADRVEHVQARRVAHLLRDVLEPQPGRPLRQRPRCRRHQSSLVRSARRASRSARVASRSSRPSRITTPYSSSAWSAPISSSRQSSSTACGSRSSGSP